MSSVDAGRGRIRLDAESNVRPGLRQAEGEIVFAHLDDDERAQTQATRDWLEV